MKVNILDHDRTINTFWYWSAIRIFYWFTLGQLGLQATWALGSLDLEQLGLGAIRATWTLDTLGNLDFGKLGLWVTWTLRDLCFWHFGKLGLCIPWVTWTLYTLGNLDFFLSCESQKYFWLVQGLQYSWPWENHIYFLLGGNLWNFNLG